MKMKKTQSVASKALLSVAGFAAFGLTLTPPSAEAVPAFARQMGMQCSMCHSVAFPAINSFGRAFKASGYTMTGAQPQIKGEGFALPATLNMSMISKLRYQDGGDYDGNGYAPGDEKEDGKLATTDGKSGDARIVWPDEQALLIGGKVADGIGALVEWGSGEGALGYKLLFEAAKMGNTRVTIVPFSTDALGPGYGLELLNTGAQRSQRMIEDRKSFSAAQTTGVGAGAATGITLAITDPSYFVNLTQYSNAFGAEHVGAKLTDLATYARAAVMQNVAGFDMAGGVQLITGDIVDNDGTTIPREGYVIDFQAEGKVGSRALAAYLSYGEAKYADDLSDKATYAYAKGASQTKADAKNTTNLGLLVGVVPTVNAYVGARSSKDYGDTTTLGLAWMMRQNMKFELFQSMPEGGDDVTTLQMFTAW